MYKKDDDNFSDFITYEESDYESTLQSLYPDIPVTRLDDYFDDFFDGGYPNF